MRAFLAHCLQCICCCFSCAVTVRKATKLNCYQRRDISAGIHNSQHNTNKNTQSFAIQSIAVYSANSRHRAEFVRLNGSCSTWEAINVKAKRRGERFEQVAEIELRTLLRAPLRPLSRWIEPSVHFSHMSYRIESRTEASMRGQPALCIHTNMGSNSQAHARQCSKITRKRWKQK